MHAVVCTLFEGNYHYGVAALTNSLYSNGFRGSIYAGYRGKLPLWSSKAKYNSDLDWEDARTLSVAEGLSIHFLPVSTEYHLTNFKPDFMLGLLQKVDNKIEAIAYFDPDIVIKCNWNFFLKWMSHGIALVHEITDNDMPDSHPVRIEWKEIINTYGYNTMRKIESYINAGFCGILKQDMEFLNTWKSFIRTGISDFCANPKALSSFDKSFPFCFLDQDALNITAMCSNASISEMGPSAMDFTHGGWTMSHAVGAPKPWRKKFILSALAGNPPSLADKCFWANAKTPVNPFTSTLYLRKKTSIIMASFISRFYHRAY